MQFDFQLRVREKNVQHAAQLETYRSDDTGIFNHAYFRFQYL